MTDNNYSLEQIRNYAAGKVSKAIGYALIISSTCNLLVYSVEKDFNAGTLINTVGLLGGIALASGLENKLTERTEITKELTDKTGY